jgi:hypothetical protein
MKGRTTRLKHITAALALMAIAAPTAQAATEPDSGRPQLAIPIASAAAHSLPVRGEDKSGLVSSEERALMLRSEALNRKYAEQRALMLRSEALNERYVNTSTYPVVVQGENKADIGSISTPTSLGPIGENKSDFGRIGDVQVVPVSVGEPAGGFSWGDAGIGAAGAFGFALLAAGLLLAVRHGRGRGDYATA